MAIRHAGCPGRPAGNIYEVQGVIKCTSCNLFEFIAGSRKRARKAREHGRPKKA